MLSAEDKVHLGRLLEDMIERRENPDAYYACSLGRCKRCKGDTPYMAIRYCDTCELALLKTLRLHVLSSPIAT